MRAPDLLTLARALAGIPIGFAVFAGRLDVAFAVFAVAALTDAADGALARRLGLAGPRGALLDPLADKVLVVSTLAILAAAGMVPWWLFVAIASREILVGALRASAFAASENHAAGVIAKAKTLCEMVGISAMLASPALSNAGLAVLIASLVLGVAILPEYLAPLRRRFT